LNHYSEHEHILQFLRSKATGIVLYNGTSAQVSNIKK